MKSRYAIALGTIVAALSVAVPAPAAVTTPKSGWNWGDPLPQGSEIRALTFAGTRGYAAGAFGAVLRTDDGGATWTGLRTGVTANLTSLSVISPDSLVVGGGCVLRRSDDGGASFTRPPFTPTDARCSAPLAAVAFPSAQVGYVFTADGAVLRTDDGGKTFGRRTSVPQPGIPTAAAFTGADTGFVVTTGGAIQRTTDGGNSWVVRANVPAMLHSVTFVSPTVAYAVGISTLLASVDGGDTWTRRPLAGAPGALSLTGISCTGVDVCLMATAPGDRLLRTTDGGLTATSVTPSTRPVFAAAFAGATRVVAAGASGTTVVSDDAGTTFAPIGGSLDGVFTRLRAQSPTSLYATGNDGRLAHSADGGASWRAVGVSTSDDVVDVAFPSATVGYALDTSGTVMRSDNAGSSWRLLDTGSSRRPPALASPSADVVLLIGPRGILRSDDGGNQFDEVTARAVRRALLSDYDRVGSSLFAFGPRTLARSRDRGRTWTALRLPTRATRVADADFVATNSGWLLATNGRLYSTRNGGRRWTEALALGDSRGQDIAFGSIRAGFVMVGDRHAGYVLRTSNGGRSFAPQLISSTPLTPHGLVAPTASGGAALAAPASLFFTTTGGGAGTIPRLTVAANRTRLRRGGSVTVTGRLRPAEGGEQMLVASRPLSGGAWRSQTVRVAANGSFTTRWRIRSSTAFVAQWDGDDQRTGVGSTVLTVRVGR